MHAARCQLQVKVADASGVRPAASSLREWSAYTAAARQAAAAPQQRQLKRLRKAAAQEQEGNAEAASSAQPGSPDATLTSELPPQASVSLTAQVLPPLFQRG